MTVSVQMTSPSLTMWSTVSRLNGTSLLVLHGPSAIRSGIAWNTGSRKLAVAPSSKRRRRNTADKIGEPDAGPQDLLGRVRRGLVDLPRAAHALLLVGRLDDARLDEQRDRVDEIGRREQTREVKPHRCGVVVDPDPPCRAAGVLAYCVGDRDDAGLGLGVERAVDVVGREVGRYAVEVRREEMRLVVARDHQDDDAVVVAAAVVGEHVARPARVHDVARTEEQQCVERLLAHRRLQFGEPFPPHTGEVELAAARGRGLSEQA